MDTNTINTNVSNRTTTRIPNIKRKTNRRTQTIRPTTTRSKKTLQKKRGGANMSEECQAFGDREQAWDKCEECNMIELCSFITLTREFGRPEVNIIDSGDTK